MLSTMFHCLRWLAVTVRRVVGVAIRPWRRIDRTRSIIVTIGLQPYERQALEVLETAFTLERSLVVELAQCLSQLYILFGQVGSGGDSTIKTGRVVVLGLINHTHHLLVGGLHALQFGNGQVWSACARGLMETFGACVLISEKPRTAPNYVEHIKPGRLRAAAERAQPGLGRDIDRLNCIVHPSSRAIYAGFRFVDPVARSVQIRFGLQSPTVEAGREGVVVLSNLAKLLLEKLKTLSSNAQVLVSGKTIAVRD
jgi:hypothetical protein